MSDEREERCETCRWWEANTVARVMGWCRRNGPRPAEDIVAMLMACVPYKHVCGEHTPGDDK